MDSDLRVGALQEARQNIGGWFEIMKTDQGARFASHAWTGALKDVRVKSSEGGKGRWTNNIFIARPWRSLKHEEVYFPEYLDLAEPKSGVSNWMGFCNHKQ